MQCALPRIITGVPVFAIAVAATAAAVAVAAAVGAAAIVGKHDADNFLPGIFNASTRTLLSPPATHPV